MGGSNKSIPKTDVQHLNANNKKPLQEDQHRQVECTIKNICFFF